MMSSGGDGASAPSATPRGIRAARPSPAMPQASATNEAPAAMPPNQKYSGTSQVHTGAFIIGPCTTAGGSPPRPRRVAAGVGSGAGRAAGGESGAGGEKLRHPAAPPPPRGSPPPPPAAAPLPGPRPPRGSPAGG